MEVLEKRTTSDTSRFISPTTEICKADEYQYKRSLPDHGRRDQPHSVPHLWGEQPGKKPTCPGKAQGMYCTGEKKEPGCSPGSSFTGLNRDIIRQA